MNHENEVRKLIDSDPDAWTLADLQRWILEAERLLDAIEARRSSDTGWIAPLLSAEIACKRSRLSELWNGAARH